MSVKIEQRGVPTSAVDADTGNLSGKNPPKKSEKGRYKRVEGWVAQGGGGVGVKLVSDDTEYTNRKICAGHNTGPKELADRKGSTP